MMGIKGWMVGWLAALALMLPGCDYAVEGYQDGVEDYIAETTMMFLEAILPIREIIKPEE